jgi:hypothetical protein
MALRRIVFQVDARQAPLRRRKNFVLIGLVVFSCLKQDAIESQIAHSLDGNIVDIVAEGERPASSTVAFPTAGTHRQIKLHPRLRQVEQVIAVDVPGENPQRRHSTIPYV